MVLANPMSLDNAIAFTSDIHPQPQWTITDQSVFEQNRL